MLLNESSRLLQVVSEREMEESELNIVVSVYDNIMVYIWSNGQKNTFP